MTGRLGGISEIPARRPELEVQKASVMFRYLKICTLADLGSVFTDSKKYFLNKDTFLLFNNKYILLLRHQFKS